MSSEIRSALPQAALIAIMSVVVPLVFSACGDMSEELTEAPQLDIECNFTQTNGCDPSNTGRSVFAGIKASTDVQSCRSQLGMISSNEEFKTQFLYTSQTKTDTNGSVITAVFTRWVNVHDVEVRELANASYRLCAFIDLDGNDVVDTGEPFADTIIKVGESFPPLSNWSTY